MEPLTDSVALRMFADCAGFSMLRLDQASTRIAHTWYAILEAAEAFGVADGD